MANNETQETSAPEKPVYPGEATLEMVDDIIRNPVRYGLDWDGWNASSKTDKDGKVFPAGLTVLRKDFKVLPKVIDAKRFGRYFGDKKLVDAYNGTSGRVTSQEIARSLLLEHWNEQRAAKVTEYMARVEVVKRHLLEQRAKGGGGGTRKHWIVNGVTYLSEADAIAASKVAPKVYAAMDGSEHKTPLEAKQATVAYLMSKGMTNEQAVALVANMPE